MDFLRALIDPAFMPHGHCYYWKPGLVWLQVVSNLIIGASYVSISITLFTLTRRMRGLPFQFAYVAFGLFIVLCGITHLFDVVTVWKGVYWLDGGIRALTAVASAATAIWLFPLFPQVVSFGELIVAERAMSRNALAARERDLREVVDNLPDLAWSARPDGHIEFYNRRWYEYTGTSPEDMEGWGWRNVHHPDHVGDVEARWKDALETGMPLEMEFPLRGADGRFRWFLTRVRPLRDDKGTIVRWIGTNTEIEEQRRARAELRRSVEARDEFLSVASHELRTPLSSLTLQLQISQKALARGDDPSKIAGKLDIADRQLTRLATLIDSMLDVSRISLDRLELRPEHFDLVVLVREVIERKRETALRQGSSLTLTAPDAATGTWDRSRIDQVVTNLIANAIKYGEGKPIDITIEARDREVEIAVRDRGIGISAEDQARIFDRFERAVSRNFGGLGLGLYISKEIVVAHRGSLSVTSEAGAGSTFRVKLPTES